MPVCLFTKRTPPPTARSDHRTPGPGDLKLNAILRGNAKDLRIPALSYLSVRRALEAAFPRVTVRYRFCYVGRDSRRLPLDI